MKQVTLGRTEVGAVAAKANSFEETSGRHGWLHTVLRVGLGLALVVGVAGCRKAPQPTSAQGTVDQNPGDPADANLAPVGANSGYAAAQPAQVLAQNQQNPNQQQGEDYGPQQQAAPIERRAPGGGDQNAGGQNYDNGQLDNQQAMDLYSSDLTDAEASDPPPPLPDYDQPPAPDPNYLWTPGYWAWGPGGYYWVPGCWVAAPYAGALWTPGYWGFVGGRYRFHHGFWGLHIGFYGGVDYGFGYTGYGYYGGYWNGGNFFYNTAVNRVNVNVIRNVYVHNVVINNRTVNGGITNRVSFNGGRGGIQAQPRPAEVAVLHEQRIAPMASQVQVQREAAQNRQQFYSANQGRPAVAVNARPVVADRTLPAALPRVAGPVAQTGVRNEARPVQTQGAMRQSEVPQARPQSEVRQAQPQMRQSEVPQTRPQSEVRQAQPQPEVRQAQPQMRQAQPQPEARQAQPQLQARPQQSAPPREQPQARPAPAPQQARPAPAPHPQPQAKPAPPPRPQSKDEPHGDDKPHR